MTPPAPSTIRTCEAVVRHDGVLIIGAGLAGLYLALKAAPIPCVIAAPFGPGQAASSTWAQGGLAAALAPDDTPEQHASDTAAVGAGLTDVEVAAAICAGGPALVEDLAALGAPFERTPEGAYALGLEAAHSAPRVARVKGDGAGKAIMRAVGRSVTAAGHVTVRTGLIAQSLIQDDDGAVCGAVFRTTSNDTLAILAPHTVLATGGVGGLYAVTTNPPLSSGAAMALALRAGGAVMDAEFVQFHPTALDIGVDPAPLATEALRGEGAVLVGADGQALCDPLAARDIVARQVHAAKQSGRAAFLDARAAIGAEFPERFPAVFAASMRAGVDPRTTPLPVAPAAHYHMGGVAAGIDARTGLDGLWAVGEAARTGMHGANRLASNSLLEAGVVAANAAGALHGEHQQPPPDRGLVWRPSPPLSAENTQTLRRAMADHTGVVRTKDGLGELVNALDRLPPDAGPVLAARAIAMAALARRDRCGAHWRADAPERTAPPTPSQTVTLTSNGDLAVTAPAMTAP